MKPTLIILAAGVGRRYGGLKQLESVGPAGETIMDFSIYDAVRAGFGQVVFVIRPDMESAFHATIGRRYEQRIPVAYAFQRLDALPAGFSVPPGRTKPWGTGQAVLSAADSLHGPFAVANADDFYGAGSFAALSAFLQQPQTGAPVYALVGYVLRNTLSESGAVSRAICRCTAEGWLEDIVETHGIERDGDGARRTDEQGQAQRFTGNETVSMNLWGFVPAFVGELRSAFERFLSESGASTDAELYLPAVVRDALRHQRARVSVLPSTDRWCGITNPRDKEQVVAFIGQLVDHGVYPAKLWD
jgi:NDP-sugar pyrophosphorylase family protein